MTDTTAQKSATLTGQQAPLRPVGVPDVDPEDPPEEFADALEAEDFVIYGKASIEQFDDDDPPEVLDMGALEDALDRFFDSEKAPGVISIGHEDLPIGRPLRDYQIDEEAAIEVGDDAYEFDAGDTITTHVEDADGDERPELWLVADLANDTDIARKARLGVLTGELDGFSVTIGRKATQREAGGRRVTDLDLFAVTLGPQEIIRNKGSEFDLAAFKADMAQLASPTATADDAPAGVAPATVAEELARGLRHTMSSTDDPNDTNGLLKRMGDALRQKAEEEEEQDGQTAADDGGQKADDMPPDEEEEDDSDATEDLVAALADDMDVSEEALVQALQGVDQNADDNDEDEDDEDEDGQKADEDADGAYDGDGAVNINFAEKLAEHGVVTEDDLGEKLDEHRESIVDDLGQKLAETNKEAVEEIAQKMDTAGTPTPAGGSFQDSEDFETHLEDVTDGEGW